MQAMSTDSSEETSTPLTFEGEGVAYDANNNLESGAENCERGADQKVAATNRASGALEAWLNLGLSPWISERCVELGFNAPTTVQVTVLYKSLSNLNGITLAQVH
jgi:superfamily II DNA/RNA helicase